MLRGRLDGSKGGPQGSDFIVASGRDVFRGLDGGDIDRKRVSNNPLALVIKVEGDSLLDFFLGMDSESDHAFTIAI